ncbi:hypothetical protein THAOC_21302 [Thalassiosira oceanica]|uniref:Uncharacterized protein n=1 Tax=Thalassiosira oceanica TaxID=159749 RepID=K0RXM9_THAOC|nr:hypothetical protein THAOC_21302 [Thalassiosira oceanica]|eukprot:EJK58563.1 hypothetical protein THAOC_21302 [Thalassiosira oceanica]
MPIDRLAGPGAPYRNRMNEAYKDLIDFCQGGDLTVSLLRKKLEASPEDIVRGNLKPDTKYDLTLLHCVCSNPRVTLDIVRYLVDIYPEAVRDGSHDGRLPLHEACRIETCPDDVIEYLVDLHPDALGVSWARAYAAGLPLHCLLLRKASNRYEVEYGDATVEVKYELNLDIVRRLVETYPEALTNQDNESNRTPLLCACEREDLSMDLVRLLVDPELSVLAQIGGYGDGKLPLEVLMDQNHLTKEKEWSPPFEVVRYLIKSAPATITPSLMVNICRSRYVTLETVKLIVETRPDVSLLDQQSDGMLPLHSLCLNDRKHDDANSSLLPIIEYVVDLYPDAVTTRNRYGFLPIAYAVNTTLEITRFLYERNPDPLYQDMWGRSLLASACQNGGIDTVKYLFKYTASQDEPLLHISLESDQTEMLFDLYPEAVAARNDEGRLPLHEFLSRDQFGTDAETFLEIVQFLVTQFPASLKLADHDGMLPLHHACKNNCPSCIVKFLVGAYEEGIKVDSPKYGLPLHCVCAATSYKQENTLEIIAFLLSKYPEAIGARNETVGTPLEVSYSTAIFEAILRQRYSGKTPYYLHHSLRDDAILSPIKVVRFFIKNFGGNVKEIDNLGRYPLHVAASSPRASREVVKELLNFHPAAALHQDKQGCIPLHSFLCNCASLETSVQNGIFDELMNIANIEDTSEDSVQQSGSIIDELMLGLTLVWHRSESVFENYRFISEALNVKDRNGCLPLHVACRRGALSVLGVKLLGALDNTTVQSADNDRELPLHKACRGGHLEIINYLLEQYAPASGMRNASGYLPIHILCRKSGKGDLSAMETPEYTETVFRLLRAHPEAVHDALCCAF